MKVLVLNASHRPNGTISNLLRSITDNLSAASEIDWVNLHDYQIKPCIGCMKCRSSKHCCLPEDGAHTIAVKLRSADALVVGSPVYWGNIAGNLKVLFDRVVPVLMTEDKLSRPVALQKGKKAAFVTSCTTPFPFNFIFAESRGSKRAIKEIFHFSGYSNAGMLTRAGTKSDSPLSERIFRKAKRIANRIEAQ